MKKIIALLLAFSMVLALCGCGKSEAIKNVEQQIEGLSDNLTVEDSAYVAEVRAAYDSLEEKEKGNVDNYQKLLNAEKEIDKLQEQVWMDLFQSEIDDLEDIVEDCGVVIDLYSRIAKTAADMPYVMSAAGGNDVNTYYKYIRGMDGSEDIIGAYKIIKTPFPLIAIVVYPEKYSSSFSVAKYLSKYDSIMEKIAVDDDDIEIIVNKCLEYNALIDDLPVKNSICFERIKLLKASGVASSKEEMLEALYNYYLSVDNIVNYVLEPSGSLSNVVSGYSSMLTVAEQAKKKLDLVS